MGSILELFMYLIIIAFIAYFIIKEAVKNALKEYNNEKKKNESFCYTVKS